MSATGHSGHCWSELSDRLRATNTYSTGCLHLSRAANRAAPFNAESPNFRGQGPVAEWSGQIPRGEQIHRRTRTFGKVPLTSDGLSSSELTSRISVTDDRPRHWLQHRRASLQRGGGPAYSAAAHNYCVRLGSPLCPERPDLSLKLAET